MRRLHCQLPANVMVKLYYYSVYSYLTCFTGVGIFTAYMHIPTKGFIS